jgi:hypothetical protein
MTRRLLSVLFAIACLAMVVALFQMIHEMSARPDIPAVRSAGSKSPAVMPQRPGSVAAPRFAETSATQDSTEVSIEDALSVEGAIQGEALLTFRSAEALAAFAARAAAQGLTVISTDPALRTARVRYQDLGALKKELAEHGADITYAGPNLIARIPGLPAQPQADKANAGGTVPFRSQGLDLIGASGNRC